MPEPDSTPPVIFGLDRRRRFKIYRWGALSILAGFGLWALFYLRPTRWRKYTDGVAFEQVARDVEVGRVAWEPGAPAGDIDPEGPPVRDPAVSVDGARMVYASGLEGGNADLYLRRWDGTEWGAARRLRALGSAFHERAPALSADGALLYFATDRPGGAGGWDIWVAQWDGGEYAWPVPLTGAVNTAYDETDPAPAPDGARLYFASDRPHMTEGEAIRAGAEAGFDPSKPMERKEGGDFDLYAADLAGDTPFELITERQLSMLYSLREGALADPEVMRKLGGSRETEAAVDRGLAYLAGCQSEDGRWDIRRGGGQGGHDVAATAFALLAFYGRGERHDIDCRYRETVARGLAWLLSQQDRATGDLRGERPQSNAMYDHGIASLALVEAYGVTKDPQLRPRAVAAVEFIAESQHEGGGWRYRPGERGDLSVTGWYIMALASAQMSGIPVAEGVMAKAERFLRFVSGGEHGGSYGYTDPPGRRGSGREAMDAVGFFCSQLLGESPNAPLAFESARTVGRHGVRVSDLYYLYYGTLASYQHQGQLWRDWRGRMQDGLLRAQERDGSWRAGGNHGGQMGRVIGTALTLLCLEAQYRYTPLYGLGYEPPERPVPDAKPQSALPPTPLFRNAKRLDDLASAADDTGPCPTDHGDFLYFASAREGGFGGSDLYRSRVVNGVFGAAENLGGAVNGEGDESAPALRMEGFHLLYDVASGGGTALHSAKTARLAKRYRFALPGFGWWLGNLGWLLLLAAAISLGVASVRKALRGGPATGPATREGAGST